MNESLGCIKIENEEILVIVVKKEEYSISDQMAVNKAVDILQMWPIQPSGETADKVEK